MTNRRFGKQHSAVGKAKVRQTLVQNATGVIHLTVAHEMDTFGTHPPDCIRAN